MMSMIKELDLDLTGTSVNNFIADEPHTLSGNHLRAVVPRRGVVYRDSIVVRDSKRALKSGEDYYTVGLDQFLSAKTGKEVVNAIIINNPQVGSNIRISYQAVGGPYIVSNTFMVNLAESILKDNRRSEWANVLNRPPLYPPTAHPHYAVDIKGWGGVIHALERIVQTKTLTQVDLVKTILLGLTDQFTCGQVGKSLPNEKLMKNSDILYLLSQRKILSRVAIDVVGCNWVMGRMNRFAIDCTTYEIGQPVYWQFYKEEGAPLSIPIQHDGLVVSNGKIMEQEFYLPSPHQHEEEHFYIGGKIDALRPDFDAVTRRLRYKYPNSTISTVGLVSRLCSGDSDTLNVPAISDRSVKSSSRAIIRHRSLVKY